MYHCVAGLLPSHCLSDTLFMLPPSPSVLGIIISRYTRPQPIAMGQIRKAEAKINTVMLEVCDATGNGC